MSGMQMGASFGKYRLIRLVGRGGMGVVYLAEDETLGRQVALKILDRGLTSAEQFAGRFRQEARTVASLEHPNIVHIHALERLGDDLVIDMPYISGGSLADAEAAGPMPAGLALGYLRDILLALACCHEAGIVHRDVKPSNILITADGRAVLSDFGLAKLMAEYHNLSLSQKTSSGFFLGTPRYAPPEAWDGFEPEPSWDVYSLGMVLYEALSGTVPYQATSPLSYMKELAERQVPPLSEILEGISPELSALTESMMVHDKTARPQSAGEVLEHLVRVPELESGAKSLATTISRPRLTRAHRRRLREERLRLWFLMHRRQLANTLLIALTLVVITLASIPLISKELGARAAPKPAAVSDGLDWVEKGYGVFDTVDPDAQITWPRHLLLQAGESPEEYVAFAVEGTHLWYMHLRPQASGLVLTISGHWAEYGDATARVFRYGAISGTGRWLDRNVEAALTLRFQSLQDGSLWSHAYLMRASAGDVDRASFFGSVLSNQHFPVILNNELLPRHLTWAEEIESMFLCPFTGCISAAFLTDETGGVRLDGLLDEPAWTSPFLGERPGLQAEEHAPAMLRTRYDKEALYLSLHAETVPQQPGVILTVLRQFDVPASQSAHWSAQFEGGNLISSRHAAGNRVMPWPCDWSMASVATDRAWNAEIRIPFAEFGESSNPEPGERWRVNCAIVSGGTPVPSPSIRWGAADTQRAELGFILVFGSR